MILAELEDAYRQACEQSSLPVVIVSMHVAEDDIRVLKPRLEAVLMAYPARARSSAPPTH